MNEQRYDEDAKPLAKTKLISELETETIGT